MAKERKPLQKRLSITLHDSVEQAITDLAAEQNISFTAQVKQLIAQGLSQHGVTVRNREVVNN